MSNRYSNITVRKNGVSKKVAIGSDSKPKIVSSILEKWQTLIDGAAQIAGVPSALIMKLNEDSIEVFIKSNGEGNPYEKGEKAPLVYGLYCETVIGTQNKLEVPDATKSKVWKDNNPDVDLNMISYLGFPINWPDGEVFGTVCLLDSKENHYQQVYNDYLFQVKQHIETDLSFLVSQKKLTEKSKELEQLNNIKSRFLSLISHDIRGAVGTLDMMLKLIISRVGEMKQTELTEILKSLRESTRSTYTTLESLLDWAKQDLFNLKPDKKQFDLVPVIKETINYFDKAIEFKELNILTEFETDNTLVIADKNMIQTAIRNILSNAINYTNNRGKITIKLSKLNNKVVIEIEDSGVGMTQKELDNLFKLKKEKTTGGAGIGLILTKDFLEKNNASIKVTSKLKKGTKFKILI